jgi:hypothetical protein
MSRKKGATRSKGKRPASHEVASSATGEEYVEMPSPFEGLAEEEIISRVKALGEDSEAIFKDSLCQLQDQSLKLDPISLLSYFSFYHLNASLGPHSEWPEKDIGQSDVEFIQSLILQHKLESFEGGMVGPSYDKFSTTLKQLSHSSRFRRFSRLQPSMSIIERQRLNALEQVRAETQQLRNWGYPQQIERVVVDLFKPFDDEIERKIGVRIAHLVSMCYSIITLAEERANRHINAMGAVIRAKNVASVAELYHRAFPDLTSKPEELSQVAKEQKLNARQMGIALLHHSDLRLSDIYTFSFDDFLRAYPSHIDADILREILRRWALSFGDLSTSNAEYFLLDNPIWHRPIILIEHDQYFVPIIGLFISFCLELMEDVVKTDPPLFQKYIDYRGTFLENEARNLFAASFPSALVLQGSLWSDPVTGETYENDVLVMIDSYLIIIEAKSGKVTGPARRGAEHRLQNTVDKLMIEPSEQARRFAKYLRERPGVHRFPTRRGHFNEIDTSGVFEVIRLNITLEMLGTISARWPELRDAGFVPEDIELIPTLSLTDLEIIFDILVGACEKLHYLVRRAEFEMNAHYLGDEMDLLSFYIDTGFNIGEAEFGGDHWIFLYGMSQKLIPYFMSQWTGRKAPKPRRRLTKRWGVMLQNIESRRTSRWTEVGYVLLNVAYEDQVLFERKFLRIQQITRTRWLEPDHQNTLFLNTGPNERRDVIAGYAYKRVGTRAERNRRLMNVGSNAIDNKEVDRTVVIGVDVEKHHYPYSVLVCVLKKDLGMSSPTVEELAI